MRFEDPIGHASLLAGLWRAARAGRIAHALCFSGPLGVGKFLAAERFAFGLFCASGVGPPCGACGPCKRLIADSHPDVFVLDPVATGDEILFVSQIAARPEDSRPNVGEFLSLRAMEGGYRVVLVREADRMNVQAQNALLKTLEEPGDDVVIVLETSRPDLLLPTVHSRCVRLRFTPPALDETRALLIERGLSTDDAADFARWCDGAPGAALACARSGGRAMRELLDQRVRGSIDPVGALAQFAEVEGDFAGKTPTAMARARARTFLDLALAVLADAVRVRAGADATGLAHGDLAQYVAEFPPRWIRSRLEQCLTARQDVDLNLAPDAVIERILWSLEPVRAPVLP